jgi:hypothetical protein
MGVSYHQKSLSHIPYNFFFVVFYAALGVAVAIHPINAQTTEIAGANAAWLGRLIAALFFVMAYLSWRYEFQGAWLTVATLPAVIWGAYTMTSILGNDRTSWVTAVYVAGSIGFLVTTVEKSLRIAGNEALMDRLIKENIEQTQAYAALKLELEALKSANKANERPAN